MKNAAATTNCAATRVHHAITEILDIETAFARNVDSLDFHEVGVLSLVFAADHCAGKDLPQVTLDRLAQHHLQVETLQRRHWDRLDFPEVHIDEIRSFLLAAASHA